MDKPTTCTTDRKLARSGFSLVELIVAMFILSVVAFFTIPLFQASIQKLAGGGNDSMDLVRFIESVRQQAVKTHTGRLLHLDLVAGRAWTTPLEEKDREDRAEPGLSLEGLSVSRIDFLDQIERDPEDTAIRISRQGISDMALIHMETENQEITLKLHPFIYKVEIIPGDHTFNDCI